MRVKIFFISLLSLAMALSLISCEGEPGAIGPAGPTGTEGPQGPQGADGQNGAEKCIDCHGNNQLITAKMWQLDNSIHYTGGHAERNYSSCATCHTSQGFLERVETGITSVSTPVANPLPINCYTCHQVHNTYTQDDWALTTSSPVTFWVGGETVNLGNSNLCINCHQARPPSPEVPMPGEAGTFSVTSSRYGPHHGSQGVMLTGNSAYEVAGDVAYENSVHSRVLDCIDCHMAPVAGARDAGGHTFRVSYLDGEDLEFNENGCIECHGDLSSAQFRDKIDGTQTEIATLLETLGNKLLDKGILRSLTSVNASSSSPLELTADEVGVLWNYQYVREDNSFGVHNYKYAKALLENSIAALD